MKKKLLVLLFSLASLALVSCGGGNDVASSGASAVSAAAPATTNDATTASTPTKPKINGQIDERTGVASVGAKMTIGAKRKVGNGSGYCSTGDGQVGGG